MTSFAEKSGMRSLLLLSVMLTLCVSAFSQDEDMGRQQKKSFQRKITTTVSANYLLFLPEGYEQEKKKKWPLILFLHGAGERGTNVTKVGAHGPPKIVKSKPNFPFIVVSPQCPTGETWNPLTLLALLDEIEDSHRVDRSRIYLTGLSMGGFGSWRLATEYPERFAAVAPICGGGDTIKILLHDPKKAHALKTLPIWAFHGAKDEVVRLSESEKMINAFKSIGNDARLTVYPEAGHDSWTEAYNNQELYDWFMKHDLSQRKKK